MAQPLNAYEMFNNDAEERGIPPSGNPGAAAEWTESGEQPRPDKSIRDLKLWSWLGFLGIDHFYLRSPFTGLAKLLTLGGLGIWYIWDILQVYTESERVAKFGLSFPFDFGQGIAQGMIVEGDPKYAQRSPFSGWQLASLFGFVGADSFLLGKLGQGARKITEFIIFLVGVITLLIAWNESGVSGLITIGKIMTLLIVIFFGGIVLTNWGLSMSTIFTRPAKLFEHGITVTPTMDKALNSYTSFLKIFSQDSAEQIKKDMNYGSVNGAEFKKRFEIVSKDILETETTSIANTDNSDAKWLISYFKWLFLIPMFGFQLLVSLIKLGITFLLPWLRVANAEADATVASIEKAEAVTTGAVHSSHPATDIIPHLTNSATHHTTHHIGGARRSNNELTTEAKVLGAAVIAIVGGGALKAFVDSLVAQ